MSYDINYNVKYKSIEIELIEKINTPDFNENYSEEDVYCICEKLYRDEFLSVFCVDNIFDEKIDNEMNIIFNKLNNIEEYNEIIGENQLIIFSYDLFHIGHKLICEVMTTNKISNELLNELKEAVQKLNI